jgi:cytochrome c-type biogenesis protein
MALLILSFIAGVLTVAAPCILPLLPVVIGGSLVGGAQQRQWLRPLVIAASLAASVIIFTLLLKASTSLLGVSPVVWQVVAGVIVILLGLHFIWPQAWEKVSARSGFSTGSNRLFSGAYKREGLLGAVLIGAALGPVFSSCSPTYALIVATILPASFTEGLAYLIAYAIGMSATLLLIAYVGQTFVAGLRWLSNPRGWFHKIVGTLFVIVGLAVLLGLDKKFQAFVLEQGWYDPISGLERRLTE